MSKRREIKQFFWWILIDAIDDDDIDQIIG